MLKWKLYIIQGADNIVRLQIIDHFTNICKFYVRMRSCSKQADCGAK